MAIGLLIGGAIGLVLFLVVWILSLRRIVPPKYADVVTGDFGAKVYSVDTEVTGLERPQTVYYEWPSWLPWGVYVYRMPLAIIEVPIKHYKTFSKGNARFVCDVSVYCQILNVLEAAKRFPGTTIDDFKEGIKEIVIGAIRTTTANFTVEEVISHRERVAKKIEEEIKDDFRKWGVKLTNTAIIDIKDPEDKGPDGKPISTVVHDISAKKEAEINSISRKEIAIKNQEAKVAEAENREKAETRSIEADEKIQKRQQQKAQMIAKEEQKAQKETMEVKRVQQVEQARITAEAMKEEAEGKRNATIEVAEGNKQKFVLEGQGQAQSIEAKGTAEAEVVKQKGLAEAEALDKKAEAQRKQQEFAKAIREIEMEEAVRIEAAKALQQAQMKFISAGSPKTFMDLLSPEGGLSAGAGLGTLLTGLKETDPDTYSKIEKFLTKKGREFLRKKQKNKEN